MAITVAGRLKVYTALNRSNTVTMSSNPGRRSNVCPLFSVVLCCLGRGLVMNWLSAQSPVKCVNDSIVSELM
jgi:hypothetical protein